MYQALNPVQQEDKLQIKSNYNPSRKKSQIKTKQAINKINPNK